MSITRETIWRRNCKTLISTIDKIVKIMDGVEPIHADLCSRLNTCTECPLYVVLADYPKGICVERVVRQAQVQARDPSRGFNQEGA